MDKKELIIVGIIIVLAVVIAGFMLAPEIDAKSTTSIDLLNKGDISENGTLYIKLKDNAGSSLSGKTLHIKLTDKENQVIYDKSVETHATGVAIAKLENITSGEYDLNITFDGDENYTSSSVSQKITVGEGEVEEQIDDMDLVNQTIQQAQDSGDYSTDYQQSYSQSSYSSQSSSSSNTHSYTPSRSSSSDSGELPSYDENGIVEYDENGNYLE